MYDIIDKNKLDLELVILPKPCLISTIKSIKSYIDTSNYVCGIFIYLWKAFDTVIHGILYDKLTYYGFRGISQLLIKSYLSNHQQYVY